MNRAFLSALLPAAALPLLVDVSLKGVALLLAAAACALAMRRASAAARHLVWLAAVVALLGLPLLAAMLPGWRVLPEWAELKNVSGENAPASPAVGAAPAPPPAAWPGNSLAAEPSAAPLPLPPPPLHPAGPLAAEPDVAAPPLPVTQASAPASAESPAGWIVAAWLTGSTVLLLRLLAAHWMLRRNARRCTGISSGPLHEALTLAAREAGVRRPVRLLLDAHRTIPVVWGILRPHLLLPVDARAWDGAQLRSVLLHELAHLRRHDTAVQALAGIACAIHWFNPLVWFAAWRLHVERERACDDLVLARGVRPSDYAGHLLFVAAEHTAARWTAVCGLAMARPSSLEGRLLAVLSDKLNRRGLTRTLTAAAILLSTAVAVPVAMLRAAEEKAAGYVISGTPAKGNAVNVEKDAKTPALEPEHPAARTIYQLWQSLARTNGDIPGGLIGRLAADLKDPADTELTAMLGKLDATRDLKSHEAVSLLNELAQRWSARLSAPAASLAADQAQDAWPWFSFSSTGQYNIRI